MASLKKSDYKYCVEKAYFDKINYSRISHFYWLLWESMV